MTKQITHRIQLTILKELLFTQGKRFAELHAGKNVTSAHFTFHLDKLVGYGMVQKYASGAYALTVQGKRFANGLTEFSDSSDGPKISVLLQVERVVHDKKEFLIQRRSKHPYFGLYGRISGKVLAGESFEASAQRVLMNETGLRAQCTFSGLLRKRDYDQTGSILLEDKLFAIMRTRDLQGKLIKKWSGGQNLWMSPEAFLRLSPDLCFKSARDFMSLPDSNPLYSENVSSCKINQY